MPHHLLNDAELLMQLDEVLTVAARLSLTERLLVARWLLDSVLTKQVDQEVDDQADWQQLSLSAL